MQDESKQKLTACWSNHAMWRVSRLDMSVKDLYDAWVKSKKSVLSKRQQAYKFKVYGMKSLQNRYFWSAREQLLFTVFITNKGKWYIQTITKGRGDN